MSAAPPGVLFIATIPDASGATVVEIEVDYNSSTGALTGASATNNTAASISVSVSDSTGAVLRTLSLAPGASTVNARQLQRAGFSTAADCNGLTFDLA